MKSAAVIGNDDPPFTGYVLPNQREVASQIRELPSSLQPPRPQHVPVGVSEVAPFDYFELELPHGFWRIIALVVVGQGSFVAVCWSFAAHKYQSVIFPIRLVHERIEIAGVPGSFLCLEFFQHFPRHSVGYWSLGTSPNEARSEKDSEPAHHTLKRKCMMSPS